MTPNLCPHPALALRFWLQGLGVRARDFGIKCGNCQAKGDRTAGELLINFLKWDELFLEI